MAEKKVEDLDSSSRVESSKPKLDFEGNINEDSFVLSQKSLLAFRNIFKIAEYVIYAFVALALVFIAGDVLLKAATDFVSGRSFAYTIIDVINQILLAIILMELLGTVVQHFTHGGFQLKPFLIVGIISSVRRILVVGASLSLKGTGTYQHFQESQIELGISVIVIVFLAISLLMINRVEE